MAAYLALGAAVVFGLYLLLRAFLAADAATLARTLRRVGIGLAVLVLVFLAVTGRIGLAMLLGSFLLPLILGRGSLLGRLRMPAGPKPGRSSSVRSRFLRMELDHDSGEMSGEVLDGPLRGRMLDGLSPEEQLDLLGLCRQQDPQSAALLEAWLDRSRPDWRDAWSARKGEAGAESGPSGSRFAGPAAMTRDEAYEILGLERGATPEAIKEAHRRLMLKLHPDQGGSNYLAAQINRAKDILLNV
jgi:DnaJ-domain-containing protein 1